MQSFGGYKRLVGIESASKPLIAVLRNGLVVRLGKPAFD